LAETGLGQPSQFFSMLRHIGVELSEQVAVPDHALLPLHDIQERYAPDYIVVTAKDAVKVDRRACDNVWIADIEALLPDQLLSSVEQLLCRVSN
jgi:tetraacyldisaccharide 4'-kinase